MPQELAPKRLNYCRSLRKEVTARDILLIKLPGRDVRREFPKMKLFLFNRGKKKQRGGFSLVEAAFSIGLLSFGILTLAPMLALGLKTSRLARDDRATAQIAQTLIEEAEQGTLAPGTVYLDFEGAPCSSPQAAYRAQSTSVPLAGNAALDRLTLQVTPLGAPDRARTYAVVFQAPAP
jgi:uncharacterized protein (TIGR02598 family)